MNEIKIYPRETVINGVNCKWLQNSTYTLSKEFGRGVEIESPTTGKNTLIRGAMHGPVLGAETLGEDGSCSVSAILESTPDAVGIWVPITP